MMFLHPRITDHELYGRIVEAIKADEPIHFLVCVMPIQNLQSAMP